MIYDKDNAQCRQRSSSKVVDIQLIEARSKQHESQRGWSSSPADLGTK